MARSKNKYALKKLTTDRLLCVQLEAVTFYHNNEDAVNVLQQVKPVQFLWFRRKPCLLNHQVAQYFEIPIKTLNSYTHRAKHYFKEGIEVISSLESQSYNFSLNGGASKESIWDAQTVAKAAFILKGEIAQNVRHKLICYVEQVSPNVCEGGSKQATANDLQNTFDSLMSTSGSGVQQQAYRFLSDYKKEGLAIAVRYLKLVTNE